jgi:hypothetical protein
VNSYYPAQVVLAHALLRTKRCWSGTSQYTSGDHTIKC